MLADVGGDGSINTLLTHSSSKTGAHIATFTLDRRPMAETQPIGTGAVAGPTCSCRQT